MPLKINNLSQMMNNCGNSSVHINFGDFFAFFRERALVSIEIKELRVLEEKARILDSFDEDILESAMNWQRLPETAQERLKDLMRSNRNFNILDA